jgi:two-component system sensor histidine kinase KdpD
VHALFNLLDNACRVSPPGQAVLIRQSEEAGRAVLEIQDRGPGLPEEVARAEGRAPSRNGSGFGLFAARRFVEANHGELAFERLPGGGTASRIALPLAPPGEHHLAAAGVA